MDIYEVEQLLESKFENMGHSSKDSVFCVTLADVIDIMAVALGTDALKIHDHDLIEYLKNVKNLLEDHLSHTIYAAINDDIEETRENRLAEGKQ
jgi:UDP-N-acetylmuramyl tripeptide synthase